MNVLDTLNFVNIVFGGDLNADFDTADHFCGVLLSFADDLGVRFVFDKVPLDARKTFRVEATGASSCIDHFAVSQALYDTVNSVHVFDSGINLSDHSPLILDLGLLLADTMTQQVRNPGTTSKQLNFCWDHGDLFQYFYLTGSILSTVHFPVSLVSNVALSDHRSSDIISHINLYYDNIVSGLYGASCQTIPKVKRNFYKYWWDERGCRRTQGA